MADEVPEGSGVDSTQGSGASRCKWLMKFWRVRVQIANKVPDDSDVYMLDEVSNGQVLEGSVWLIRFGGFRRKWPMKFPAQIANKIGELFDIYSRQSSGPVHFFSKIFQIVGNIK